MSKPDCEALLSTLQELKEASYADVKAEPSFHLFIIKQSFIPNSN